MKLKEKEKKERKKEKRGKMVKRQTPASSYGACSSKGNPRSSKLRI